MAELTKRLVDAFECPPGVPQTFLWCSFIRGFGVRATANGTKSFIVQSRVGRKQIRETLGRYGVTTLDEAQKRARRVLQGMRDGVDPRAEKKRIASMQITLREIVEDYKKNKRTKNGPLRARTMADIDRHLNGSFEGWAEKPVAGINRTSCVELFDELSDVSPSQANQAFVILRALLNHAREMTATENGDYPLLAVNPVQRMLKLRKLNPEVARVGRIPLDKVGAVWNLLEERMVAGRTINDQNAAALVAVLLLTGMRKTEGSTLTKDRVNLPERRFSIPSDIAKNHNPLVFPVTNQLFEIFSTRPPTEDNEYVFASWGKKNKHVSDPRGVMEKVSTVAGLHLTLHDLRRTFDDIAKACGVDFDERRQLLNHLSSDVHGRHYANNPDPAALAPAVQKMHDWIVEQGRIAGDMASGRNVVAIRA